MGGEVPWDRDLSARSERGHGQDVSSVGEAVPLSEVEEMEVVYPPDEACPTEEDSFPATSD